MSSLISCSSLLVLCIVQPTPAPPPPPSPPSSQFSINYLVVVALVGEFCNKFILCLFFVICPQYGTQSRPVFSLFSFSLIAAVGLGICSILILVVFKWCVYRKEYGIPSIGSISGIVAGNSFIHSIQITHI